MPFLIFYLHEKIIPFPFSVLISEREILKDPGRIFLSFNPLEHRSFLPQPPKEQSYGFIIYGQRVFTLPPSTFP